MFGVEVRVDGSGFRVETKMQSNLQHDLVFRNVGPGGLLKPLDNLTPKTLNPLIDPNYLRPHV